jgi:hypothetical protein
VVIVINNSDKQVGLYSGGLIFGEGAYIWNEVSVSTCGGLIPGGGLYSGGGLIVGGLRYCPGSCPSSVDIKCTSRVHAHQVL